MKAIYQTNKRKISVVVTKKSSTGPAIVITVPERRVLDSKGDVISGFDWATASIDTDENKVFWLFDSTLPGLSAIGTYYVEFKAKVGDQEVYSQPVTVKVRKIA